MASTTRKRTPPQKLTPSKVRKALVAGLAGNHPDTLEPGLSLRVRGPGKASWAFSYVADGKQHRLKLADVHGEDTGLAEARAIANDWRQRISQSKARRSAASATGEPLPQAFNPALANVLGGNAPEAKTVKAAMELYFADVLQAVTPDLSVAERNRRTAANGVRTYLTKLLPSKITPQWDSLPLASLEGLRPTAIHERRDALLTQGVGRVSINRGTQYFSAFLGWCIQNNIGLEINPLANFRPKRDAREVPRDVTPTPIELRNLWHALDDPGTSPDYRRLWRLLVLTGCRKNEIATATPDQLQDGGLVVTNSKTEAGNRFVPLSPTAQAIMDEALADKGLAGPYIFATSTEGRAPFGNWTRCQAQQSESAGNTRRITIHDCRRLAYTRLASLGIDLTVVRILLGHRIGDSRTQTYNQHSYLAEMRKAMTALETSIMADVGND